MTPTRLLTAAEVAQRLGAPTSTVYACISRHTIPDVRVTGRLSRIPEDELEALQARMVRPLADRSDTTTRPNHRRVQ